ncbi:MAG: hypothetical protein IPM51_10260 [Sphingobacteriaceae bacterium]|nr:hypothetical protein [Sphingobacteriaceae bacterium]
MLSPLQNVSYLESTHYMSNQLLRDSDVFSMAHSLELRVPFVDHLLYAVVLPCLESSYELSFPKKMLVGAVGDIPDEIVHRPKMGFTFPFAHWMQNGKIKSVVKEKLLNKNSLLGLNSNAIEQMFTDFEKGKVHWSRIWALIVAQRYF